jgi:hypothetical protein
MRTTHLLIVLPGLLLLAAPPQTQAEDYSLAPPVLYGCDLGPNPLPFFHCVIQESQDRIEDAVDQANDASQQIVGQLQEQLQKPVVAAINQLDLQGFTTCLANNDVNLPQAMSEIGSNPVGFVENRMTELWAHGTAQAGTLLGPELNRIAAGQPPPSVQQIMILADSMASSLAETDPVARCAWQTTTPLRVQARSMALQIYPALKQQYEAMFNGTLRPVFEQALVSHLLQPMLAQIAPPGGSSTPAQKSLNSQPIQRTMQRQMSTQPLTRSGRSVMEDTNRSIQDHVAAPFHDAARSGAQLARWTAQQSASLVPEEVRLIALARAQAHLIGPEVMGPVTSQLNLLASQVRSNPGAAAGALAQYNAAIAPLLAWDERFPLDVGIEVARYYGHDIIDTKGRDLLNWVASGGTSVKDVVGAVATGIAGAFYEPPSAISEIVSGALQVAVNFLVITPLVNATIHEVHQQYDIALNQAAIALSQGQPPSSRMAQAGSLGPLLAHFPSETELMALAIPELETLRATLSAYHQAVQNLGDAAVIAAQ